MITYMITVSICWILLYMVYKLGLERETFFHTNRSYLMASLILGLIIPAYQWIPEQWYSKSQAFHFTFDGDVNSAVSTFQAYTPTWTWHDVWWLVYSVVATIMLMRFAYGLYKIFKLRRNSTPSCTNGLKIYYTEGKHLPFSFMDAIYLSKEVELREEIESILKHEEVHVKSWHTLDVLFVEVLQALFWFNPILLWYKDSLRQLHEFTADAIVVRHSSKKSYGQLLLRQSYSGVELALANHFFQSQIKNRIIMMYKEQSNQKKMVKYLAVLPVLALCLVMFSSHTTSIADTLEITKVANYQNASFHTDDNNPPADTNDNKLPCDKPGIYKSTYEGKKIGLRFCMENGKVTYVEIDEAYTEIKDRTKLEIILKEFSKNGAPPPPPPPPPPILRNSQPAKIAEEMPRFPGCEGLYDEGKTLREVEECSRQRMLEFIYSNVKYPKVARLAGTEGTAVVTFVIESNGDVSNIQILRNPGNGLGEEAKRVVASMNQMDQKWISGKQGGKKVAVQYTLPVKFILDDTNIKVEQQKELEESSEITVVGYGHIESGLTPMVFINGNQVAYEDLQNVKPDEIATINVYKGEQAINMFGAKAEDGVIDVVLKKGQKLANYFLYQNEPNPVKSETKIGFDLPQKGEVSLTFYNVNGQVLKELKIDGKVGYNSLIIQAVDLNHKGVIYYEMKSGTYSATKKMMVD